MNNTVQVIPLLNLVYIFLPVLLVVALLYRWSLSSGNALYAVVRMLGQLLLIGYFLSYIFDAKNAGVVLLVLAVMVFASSWIALGTIKNFRLVLYRNALLSIALGGVLILLIVTLAVLDLEPWYFPQVMIPLAGMIFANGMNSVSLSAERLVAELERQVPYQRARQIALQASLIPVINSMFAVGLVSLPGMMTGQILSGVSPLIAARYQIMVMCMIFASAGISSICFLLLSEKKLSESFDAEQSA
jgi:putative ABC transport system permease protein